MVDWAGARAYLSWLAQQSGLPWRLPGELEWEKAAGRFFPSGDFVDRSWASLMRPPPAVVDSHPVDCSPYGVRGLMGNARDWCADRYRAPPGVVDQVVIPPPADDDAPVIRSVRGGAWTSATSEARAACRFRFEPWGRDTGLGFRGVYSVRSGSG